MNWLIRLDLKYQKLQIILKLFWLMMEALINLGKKLLTTVDLYGEVVGIKLSRNFGQHFAITAGVKESRGDYIIVIDYDLQDNPKYIKDLLDKSKKGYDIVYTVKTFRSHNVIKNIFAFLYHSIFNFLAGKEAIRGSGEHWFIFSNHKKGC